MCNALSVPMPFHNIDRYIRMGGKLPTNLNIYISFDVVWSNKFVPDSFAIRELLPPCCSIV